MSAQTNDARRLTAEEILETVLESGRDELDKKNIQLALSGIAGGLSVSLSALAVAALRARLGESEGARLISLLGYPVGFLAVIIGRGQLFTENTLYPVAVALRHAHRFVDLLRLWAIVLVTNQLGVLAFSLLAANTRALEPRTVEALTRIGVEHAHRGADEIFWGAVFAGWLIALVAWTVSASIHTIGHVVMIAVLTFVIGLGHFSHSVAGAADVLVAVLGGALTAGDFFSWLGLAVSGNVLGGVVIVALINYGQVRSGG